jgi:hypothetical protein
MSLWGEQMLQKILPQALAQRNTQDGTWRREEEERGGGERGGRGEWRRGR